jgi:Spy/CpxP family protein refolding chaperone
MTRTKSIALAFYLGAALAGAAIGVSVDRLAVRAQPRWYDRREMRTRVFDELHLTQAQRDSANLFFDERNRRDSILMAPVRPAADSVNAQARQRFSQLLTPEQKSIYDHMQRDNAPRTEKK